MSEMGSYLSFQRPPEGREGAERLVLVNDITSSMGKDDWKPTRLDGAKEAAGALIKAKAESYGDDQLALVAFNTSGIVVHDTVEAGTGWQSLTAALDKLRADGETNITAGLDQAAGLLQMRPATRGVTDRLAEWVFGIAKEAPAGTCQRRVILLTDGCHNHGPKPLKTASELKGAGIVIDCIGIGGDRRKVDEELLKRVASLGPDGAPRYRFIGDKAGLIKTYKKLAGRIKRA